MVQSVNREAYRDQLHALLPAGRAWPEEAGTTLDALVRAIADEIADVDLSDARLLDEVRPDTTVDLLPDWERVVGLPDDCSRLGSNLAIRRASLLAKLIAQPNMNPSAYVAIAAEFGITITVAEHDQTRAAADSMLDTTSGKWRNVWWIGIPTSGDIQEFTTLSDVTESLLNIERNTELECRLQKAKPAHTELFVRYNPVPQLPALADRTGQAGKAEAFTLPAAAGGDAPIVYSISGLPAGKTFTPGTRVVGGTPTTAGTSTVTYTATDDDGDADSGTFEFTIARGPALVTSTFISSTPMALPDTYGAGEMIEISVRYDTAVDVDTTGGTPSLNFSLAGERTSVYEGGGGTDTIRFRYTVLAADMDDNGIFLYGAIGSGDGDIELNSGTIRNAGTSIDANLRTTDRGQFADHKVDGSL